MARQKKGAGTVGKRLNHFKTRLSTEPVPIFVSMYKDPKTLAGNVLRPAGRSLSRQRLAARHRQQKRADAIERFRPDAADPLKLIVIDERTVGAAGFDDPSGKRLADAGQLSQLRPVGLVQIDLETGRLDFRPVDLDHPALQAALREPPSGRGSQTHQHQHGHGRLVGAA